MQLISDIIYGTMIFCSFIVVLGIIVFINEKLNK